MKEESKTRDVLIVGLYFQRDETAISVTGKKYGNYLKAISKNILGSESDAEECVNDTYLRAWNSIPPENPHNLGTYLGKIVRNLSLDKYRHNTAEKRGGGEGSAVLDELADCIPGKETVESEVCKKELTLAINGFLDTLPEEHCRMFVCRYWYAMPVCDIAKRFRKRESNVSVTLGRIRNKLRTYLSERGVDA